MIGKKTITTKSSAKYFSSGNNTTNIKGYDPSYSENDKFTSYEKELKEREKLQSILRRAKASNNHELVKQLESELNIDKKDETNDQDKNQKIDEAITQYYQLLQNPELDDKTANRYMMIINSLNVQRPSGSKSTNQYMPPPMMYQPKSGQPTQETQLQNMMFEFMKSMITNKQNDNVDPMTQFERMEKMISDRMPSLKDQLEEMKDMMKLTGQYTDGNTSLEQMRLKAEMDKTDKEFDYKKKELELKKEQNQGIMDLGAELASALITGAVESLTGDDEPVPPEQAKEIPTETKTNTKDIKLNEDQPSETEWSLDCKKCETAFRIDNLDKPREVACTKCGWPHYFYNKEDGKPGYVGPDPNSDAMNGDPDKWLETYQPGQLEKQTLLHLEEMKKQGNNSNEQ